MGHCHGDAARVCFRMKRGARTFGVFDNLYSPFMLVEDADARPATVAAMASRIIIEDVQRTFKQRTRAIGVITQPSIRGKLALFEIENATARSTWRRLRRVR